MRMGSERNLTGFAIFVCMVMVELMFGVEGEPQVPCYFVFGDSLVDSGNNNNMASLARANYLPYGIDFPGGPTGRFCNGKTTVDVIGEHEAASIYLCFSVASSMGLHCFFFVRYFHHGWINVFLIIFLGL
ncbi:hypothetical protein Droror1_Dr00012023 [Drosera rotundifolia]